MIKKLTFFIFLLCLSGISSAQQRYTLSGYVKDDRGEMLIGVYVIVPGSVFGAVTNNYGFYSLTLAGGEYIIRFSYIGYSSAEFNIDLSGNRTLNVTMQPETSEIDEVTVTAKRRDENVQQINMSNVQIPARAIRKIPNLLGETDIIKSIQLLPGVQSSVEGSSGFYVRGGNSDQNLILLDGATVYNPSHLFGFFSVFNGDAVKNVELYKGGIPAEYGGRLSSVLDVRMNDGNTQKIKGSLGIGMISSRMTLEGPVIRDRMSFIVTARRTYADLFLPFARDTSARNSTVYFYDLNTKINYQVNQNNRIFLSGYFGRDVNHFGDLFQMNFGNATGTFRWNHIYNGRLFSNLTLLYSDFNYNLGVPAGILSFKVISHIKDFTISNDYSLYLNPSNTLKFGIQGTYHTIQPGTIKSDDPTSIISSVKYPENHAIESAFFLSNEQKAGSRLILLYGIRFSMFQNIGDATLYTYNEVYDVVDSTSYPSGEIFNTYTSFEPRFNIRFILTERMSLKMSYNRTAQFMQLASNSTASFPLDMWFMSSPNIKPQKADQVAAGIFRNFADNDIESSVEVFYKKIKNAIDFKDHAQLAAQQFLEGELRIGEAYSYGAEFLLRKQNGKFTGWLSYAYIRSFRKVPSINKGKRFPPPYDKPHNISVMFNYEISRHFDAGLNWVYSTAIPVTVPTSGYYYGNTWIPEYSERGGTRIYGTAYHRLDISVNFKFKIAKRLDSNINLSVYNAYNRHNAFAIYFRDKEEGEKGVEAVKLYLFPVVPSVTFNVSF